RAKNRPRSSRSRSRPSDCGMTTRSLRRASNSSRGSSPPQPLILVLIDETRTEDYAVESIHDVLHQQVAFVLEVLAQKIVGSSEESTEVKPFKVETERLRDDDEILAPGLEFFAGELAPATADPRAHRRDAHRGLCSRVDP